MNKLYYDTHFRPFYRTTQVIIRPKNITTINRTTNNQLYSSTLEKNFLLEVFYLQKNLTMLHGELNLQNKKYNITINDICFKPLEPDNKNCTIFSIFEYWQNNMDTFLTSFDPLTNDYLTHFDNCVLSPTTIKDSLDLSCLGDFGGPIFPYVSLGGFKNKEYGNATALVITFIIDNHKDPLLNLKATTWEKIVIDFLRNYSNPNVIIDFNTERSLQDELDRETQSDIKTILISYIAMFIYITITLGSYRISVNKQNYSCRSLIKILQTFIIDAKILLGIAGVVIVILSVLASIGLFSYFRIQSTLIIFEVIPFLVLAVGVDNIFILVQTYQHDERLKNESLESQISRIVGRVGPNMLLTSSAESLAFVLGTLTPMPAVKIFSLYASLSVFISFILQITCFVSLMTLDCKRELSNRYNLLCCFKQNESNNSIEKKYKKSYLFRLFKNLYAPFLMNKWIRPIVILLFMATFFSSIALLPRVNTGLDQKLTMPRDSYVLGYFKALEQYLSVGVPIYFVLKGIPDYSSIDYQNMICSSPGCNTDSILNQINLASLLSNYTKIAVPANSWLDDYFYWLSSADCCRVFSNNTNSFCPSTYNDLTQCIQCPVKFQNSETPNRPISEDFYKYLDFFLKDNPGTICSKGGHAAYGEAIETIKNKNNEIIEIGATFFMSYHTLGIHIQYIFIHFDIILKTNNII